MMQQQGKCALLAEPGAEGIRDSLLDAALEDETRWATLVRTAKSLAKANSFYWPELYTRVLHSCLDQRRFQLAKTCHKELEQDFLPEPQKLGALVSYFVVDRTLELQDTLKTLTRSYGLNMYDYIIPKLYSTGMSDVARAWRRTLVNRRDFPTVSRCVPFLQFMVQYTPQITLTPQELALLRSHERASSQDEDQETPMSIANGHDGEYNDGIVAKWFASTWISAEFAVNLAHKLGLRVIGPRALQSLALREASARDVAAEIHRLEKLGLEFSRQTYCKALIFFAKNDKDELLTELLHCDIHPDEFDDVETREMLLTAAAKQQDWKRQKLLQGVEMAIEDTTSHRLAHLLNAAIEHHSLDRVKRLLDRMEGLKLNMTQQSVNKLLTRLCREPSPGVAAYKVSEPQLDEAIDILRRIAVFDVAIPVASWQSILVLLGRGGRFEEIGQLSLEIVQLYMRERGLFPVHHVDLPQLPQRYLPAQSHSHVPPGTKDGTFDTKSEMYTSFGDDNIWDSISGSIHPDGHSLGQAKAEARHRQAEFEPTKEKDDHNALGIRISPEVAFMPADLSFHHPKHPLSLIFTPRLQRAIVRWGFDHSLKDTAHDFPMISGDPLGIRRFDLACGLRILALLRDQGIRICEQTVRNAILERLVIGTVPGKWRHRSRDEHAMAPLSLKSSFEEAWGPGLLPDEDEFLDLVDERKVKVRKHKARMFAKAFDRYPHADKYPEFGVVDTHGRGPRQAR
ncbi:hypothetical protein S40288_09543 [Stachybotrys chartarum IBT 40288]|nr:hypothetical protein S40288_09543 [Stachybotrys chartarum IBT 40288]